MTGKALKEIQAYVEDEEETLYLRKLTVADQERWQKAEKGDGFVNASRNALLIHMCALKADGSPRFKDVNSAKSLSVAEGDKLATAIYAWSFFGDKDQEVIDSLSAAEEKGVTGND